MADLTIIGTPVTPGTLDSYAQLTDLATYLGVAVGDLDADSTRLLLRASETIQHYTLNRIDSDDAGHVEAAKTATCAQVEYWTEPGESSDTQRTLKSYSIGRLSMQFADGGGQGGNVSRLAPRARQALVQAGLLYCGGSVSRGIGTLGY